MRRAALEDRPAPQGSARIHSQIPTLDARPHIAQTLAHWQSDPDLAPLRNAEPRAQLPDAERQQWQALWNQVEELRATCANNAP